MKINRLIYFIAGFILFGFLMAGILNKSINYRHEIIIQEEVNKVFISVILPGQIKMWLEDFEKAELIGNLLEDAGNQFLVTYNLVGRRTNFVMDIVSFENEEELSIIAYPPQMTISVTMIFSELESGTGLIVETSIKGNSLFWRSSLVLMKPWIKRGSHKNLKSLKKFLEKE